jgi:2'-5' RNA ligase
MNCHGYGFFPEAGAPRVFWVGIEADLKLTSLAEAIDEGLSPLNIPKEEHAFSPHLTLARAGRGSGSPRRRKGDGPNRRFQRLQEKLAAQSVPGVWCDDRARIFSLPEPARGRRIKIYEACEI